MAEESTCYKFRSLQEKRFEIHRYILNSAENILHFDGSSMGCMNNPLRFSPLTALFFQLDWGLLIFCGAV
ncbi:hypothetical protein Tco_0421810 [Tanacetum coccineum]